MENLNKIYLGIINENFDGADEDFFIKIGAEEINKSESDHSGYSRIFRKLLWKLPGSAPQRGNLEMVFWFYEKEEEWSCEIVYDGKSRFGLGKGGSAAFACNAARIQALNTLKTMTDLVEDF